MSLITPPSCSPQEFFESVFSVWPLSGFFELNGSINEWWFRWKLDRFVSALSGSPLLFPSSVHWP